jgi:hypothetical protein
LTYVPLAKCHHINVSDFRNSIIQGVDILFNLGFYQAWTFQHYKKKQDICLVSAVIETFILVLCVLWKTMFFEMTKGNLCTLNVVATTFLLLASQILKWTFKSYREKLNKNCAICLIVALCVCSGGRTILIDLWILWNTPKCYTATFCIMASTTIENFVKN